MKDSPSQNRAAHPVTPEAGFSLVETMLFILVCAIFVPLIFNLVEKKQKIERTEITQERLEAANDALLAYYEQTGRYPCPASLTAPPDTQTFGVERVGNCDAPTGDGYYLSQGRRDFNVVTGTLPVRTLGLPDEMMLDGWNKRLVYAVTANYTNLALSALQKEGAITLTDGDETVVNGNVRGNNSTNERGNVVHAVVAFGEEKRGAYTFNGALLQACPASGIASENCNNDATLRHTVSRSDSETTASYNNQLRYKSSCINDFAPPAYYSILLDTSGSMQNRATCPPELLNDPAYAGGCTRIDVAQWAVRRAMEARRLQLQAAEITDARTGFSGFTSAAYKADHNGVGYDLTGTRAQAQAYMGNIEINRDPDGDGIPNFNTDAEAVEARFAQYCPDGNTPLGIHIGGMHTTMSAPPPAGQPVHQGRHVITIVSDGVNNAGNIWPDVIISRTLRDDPNIDIFFIDTGNNARMQALQTTINGRYPNPNGGNSLRYRYHKTSEPDPVTGEQIVDAEKLKDLIYETAGMCNPPPFVPPPDVRLCEGPAN